MGRLLVLGCVVLAVTVASTTGIAAAPHTQTCHAKALAVTFTLPSDWLCAEGAPGSSIRYAGIAPAKTAQLTIFAEKEPGVTLTAYARYILATIKQDYTRRQLKATVTATRTKVGNAAPAFRITATYHGVWRVSGGQVGQITHIMYFFFHRGIGYEFDYGSVTPWITKDLPIFMESATSIQFDTPA